MVLLPLLSLLLFLAALIDIILRDSSQVKHLPKFGWIIIVILLPLIGSVLWFALGREYASTGAGPFTAAKRPPAHAVDSFARPASDPLGVPVREPSRGELSTEAQLAELEREIEFYERKAKVEKLQAEIEQKKRKALE
ncbi:PLDc N-terminal domain-containing protein [Leifsonia sp. NPDC058292]|uniref:PLDc N-terminal domain-containing protein n=1 Tax=Leifsonia sp. NPDC058292 TaxID=3346428 RepID=UPI0036D7B5E2